MFISIDNKLTGLDARVALIEVLHREFQQLRHSLEYSQQQIDTPTKENASLHQSVSNISTQLTSVTSENKLMKETILNYQSHYMKDNLIITGISEPLTDQPQVAVREFMVEQLKLSPVTVNNMSFHRVHHLGLKHPNATRPRPIIVKFEHFKQKELVQRQGKQLKGTDFGLNDQYPPEIDHRRKQRFTIRKQMMKEGKRAVISVDKLYIDGKLFKDKDVTPWLF